MHNYYCWDFQRSFRELGAHTQLNFSRLQAPNSLWFLWIFLSQKLSPHYLLPLSVKFSNGLLGMPWSLEASSAVLKAECFLSLIDPQPNYVCVITSQNSGAGPRFRNSNKQTNRAGGIEKEKKPVSSLCKVSWLHLHRQSYANLYKLRSWPKTFSLRDFKLLWNVYTCTRKAHIK